MHTHPIARHISQRRVQHRHDILDEAKELGQRPVAEIQMPLQPEIGTVELQQEPMLDDRLVCQLQRVAECVEIRRIAVVVLPVIDSAGDP